MKYIRYFYFLGLYLAPILFIELAFQYIYRFDLLSRSWAWSGMVKPSLLPNGLPAKADYIYDSRWAGTPSESPSRGPVRLRTDKYGTILPSGLSRASKDTSSGYVLFCGGSTTESSSVSEGFRPADVFAKLSKQGAVNAGKSGKDMYGCIETIDGIFRLATKRPSRIVIATNVNTLMSFAQEKIRNQGSLSASVVKNSVKDSHLSADPLYSIKKYILQVFPGISRFATKLRIENSPYAEQEFGLISGCCHGASEVNRYSSNFDWNSDELKLEYAQHVENGLNQLKAVLLKHDFPAENVLIFKEPHSFSFKVWPSWPDYRQWLSDYNGRQLNSQESSQITDNFDELYANLFLNAGFKVLAFPEEKLSSEYFIDAVHLTSKGAFEIGKYYAQVISLLR